MEVRNERRKIMEEIFSIKNIVLYFIIIPSDFLAQYCPFSLLLVNVIPFPKEESSCNTPFEEPRVE